MSLNWLSRTEAILGLNSVEKLKKASVLIAGLGGVGGYAMEGLARCGINTFILIDSDKFEETNLNRQLLCLKSDIGKNKVDIAKERILAINPDATVLTYNEFIDSSNIDRFLNMKPTVVVDAIDSIESKYFLLKRCVERNIPVVSSMGAALRKDPTAIRIADISKTSGDPLAKQVRTKLRQNGITGGIACVYSTEIPVKTSDGTLGSLATVTGTFGLALAQLAVDTIINL